MLQHDSIDFDENIFKQGVFQKLGALAARVLHISLGVVFPRKNGWGYVRLGKGEALPDFCSVIQSTREGAAQCRMCHILMSVAACRNGVVEQRCHAGASVLVSPIANCQREGLAVLSSCLYASSDDKFKWAEVRAHGEKLGVDLEVLHKAYKSLPCLTGEQAEVARSMMEAAGEALRELRAKQLLEHQLQKFAGPRDPHKDMVTEIEDEFRQYISARQNETTGIPTHQGQKGSTSTLISVIVDLVSRKPNIPYTVGTLAAAARMTPNHFSSLFHEVEGCCFSDFLTQRRIEFSKQLLADVSLSISEVATQSGYDDPGYFARRFKQIVGQSPRMWRQSFGGKIKGTAKPKAASSTGATRRR